MPFKQQFPRSFTPNGVRDYAPAQPGLYGLSNAKGWLRIEETENIRESLLDQLGQVRDSPWRPTGFVFEICDRHSRPIRRAQLTREYQPTS